MALTADGAPPPGHAGDGRLDPGAPAGAAGDGGGVTGVPPGAAPVRGPLRAHLLVCTDPWEEGCAAKGSAEILRQLRREVRDRGLRLEVRATGCACLGGCQWGPNLALYPDGVWYQGVGPDDAAELLDRHVMGGEAVERLLRRDHHPGQAGPLPLTRPVPGGPAVTGFPRPLVDGLGRRVVVPSRPTRVAAASPVAGAILQALAPARVAPLEEVLAGAAGLRSGLILADHDAPPEIISAAEGAGVPLVALAPTDYVSAVEANIGLAARALGAEPAARAVNDALDAQAEACATAAAAAGRRTRALFYRPDGTSAGPRSFLRSLIRRAGGEHVAPDAGPPAAPGPRPDDAVPLSLEDLAGADPDVLLLGGAPEAAAGLRDRLLADPRLASSAAVRAGRLHPFDPATYGHRLRSQRVAAAVGDLHRLLYPRPPAGAAPATP